MTDEKAPRRDARAARQVPSPDLPKDCFDVGNGYYDPKDGSIHDYGTKKKVRARTHASSLRWPATFPVPAPRSLAARRRRSWLASTVPSEPRRDDPSVRALSLSWVVVVVVMARARFPRAQIRDATEKELQWATKKCRVSELGK